MREYMHVHIEEGAIFKNDQILWKEALELEAYDALVFYGDLSYKDAGDYKAMVFVGKTGREFHIIDAYVEQTSRHNVAMWLYEKARDQKLLNYNISYYIEGNFAQDLFVSDFDLVGDAMGFYLPIVADTESKGNKFDRIESMAGYFERKNIFFNKEKEKTGEFQNLIDQLLAFQKGSGAHDDAPDALQSAIVKLNELAIKNTIPPLTLSRGDWMKLNKNRY
ncbi:phage terminase large subunit [Ornithobacterium rhinotracheale]